MPNIIGLSENKLIVNSSNFRRERVGIERINDVYTTRTEDSDFFYDILKNGTSHKTVSGFFSVVPPTNERYSEMLIEDFTSSNERGSVTTFNVTYVGLFKDLKPRPIISLQPVAEYAFFPYTLTAEFIEYIGTPNSSTELAFINKYKQFNPVPAKINDASILKSTVPPFSGTTVALSKAYNLNSSPFFRIALPLAQEILRVQSFGRQVSSSVRSAARRLEISQKAIYNGFVITSNSYTRYGNYAHIILGCSDSAYLNYYNWSLSVGITANQELSEKFLNWPQ